MQYNPVFVKERDSTTPKLQKLPKLKELKTYFILESDNTISLKILQLLKVPNGSLKNKPTLVKFDFFQTAK
jgi:hypothetical protein